jgi:DoxX-like family
MNKDKIIYWLATAIFCGIMLFSATMYFTKYEMVKGFFQSMGYPTYIVYPLATAKLLGIIAILTKKIPLLKEWAYAGFFFDAVFALSAHLVAKDGGYTMALVAMIMIVISRLYEGKVFKKLIHDK